MSTEIKNILYRFVTMRAPELLQQEAVSEYFVLHPESVESTSFDSSFLTAISPVPSGVSRRQALLNTVQSFASNVIANKSDLKTLVGSEFYDYAIWLNQKRSTFDIEEVKVKTLDLSLGALDAFNNEEIKIWDNLFYQIITFRSSYVRETIISLLVAKFFISKYSNTIEDIHLLRQLAQARVILPKILFGGENNSAIIENQKVDFLKLPLNSKKTQKATELLFIENNKTGYEAIRKSLVGVEKKYYRDYEKLLKEYNIQYDADVKAAYLAATREELSYIDPTTGIEEKYFIYDNLSLPEYNFITVDQLKYCKAESNPNDLHYNFLVYCQDELEFTTFKQLFDFIENTLANLTDQQFKRVTTSKKVANIDGVIINVDNNQNYARTVNGFTFLTLNSGLNKYLALTFLGMEVGTDIISGNYTLTFEDSSTLEGTYLNQSSSTEWIAGNLVLKIFNYSGHYFTPQDVGSMQLVGTFTSSTGRVLNIDGSGDITNLLDDSSNYNYITDIEDNPYYIGVTTQNLVAKGYGNYIYEDLVTGTSGAAGSNDSGAGTSNNDNSSSSTNLTSNESVIQYIPSGYGIKRLGIADYRKVEQEICCYVPGEVSHIENIMAREYKEKSTRRLRRQEDTITTSREKETEKLTDSTSTERFEMNQEVSSVLAEQSSLNLHTGVSGEQGGIRMEAAADFAHNTSQETSDHQAVTEAKEITERVLQRVVEKVKEERITKIIEEFEENSKHGYDNRKGDKHVSGVYRWVDKVYRNRLVNYGKRLMYEFMIPEPAQFHNLAIEKRILTNDVDVLVKPIDPRTAPDSVKLSVNNDFNSRYMHWVELLNVEIEPMPSEFISIGTEFNFDNFENQKTPKSWSGKQDLNIPANYRTIDVDVSVAGAAMTISWGKHIHVSVGNLKYAYGSLNGNIKLHPVGSSASELTLLSFENIIPVSVGYITHHFGNVNVSVKCQLTDNAKRQWQIETFNAIISAYEDRLKEYNDKVSELKAAQLEKVKTNPLFYRQIENIVLRKNCIEYMISHSELGQDFLEDRDSIEGIHASYDSINLENYANKVKFFEQAFEWNLMSYNFYPFYWAKKENWKALYNVDDVNDSVFRAFLQSGMARIIVTVRPGFEEAVNWYMATGQIWNGGQIPTIDDPLFISIVQELQEAVSVVEETWESRVPTSLTVIQAGSIGLNVEGLPCDEDCKDYSGFDSDNNPINTNPIVQNPVGTQLGNVVEDLETITDSIEEIKDDIEEIKTTLEGMNP